MNTDNATAIGIKNNFQQAISTPGNLRAGILFIIITGYLNIQACLFCLLLSQSGDANFDGTAIYTGTSNDRDLILTAIGGTTPTNTVTNTYSPLDINMDGTIRYTGTENDRDIILQTIGGVVPTATRTEQLP